MAPYLVLKSIKCWETTSGAGDDDVIVWFKGEPMFHQEMKGERHRNIDKLRVFDGSEDVWVKEIDEGSRDDLIGKFLVTREMIGWGEQQADLRGDGSHYVVWYEVVGSS
jgi:hypothetical protein